MRISSGQRGGSKRTASFHGWRARRKFMTALHELHTRNPGLTDRRLIAKGDYRWPQESRAMRIRRHSSPKERAQMSAQAREFVPRTFLLMRQPRDHLTIMAGLLHPGEEHIALA